MYSCNCVLIVLHLQTWYIILATVFVCYRGVGCIFFEMASGRPLFAGSAVDEQLHLIVKLLGTPSELTWPGVGQLHEFLAYEFPRYRPEPLVKHVPRSANTLCNLLYIIPPFPQTDIIGAVVIVWRARGKIIRSVLCSIVSNNCTQ